MRANAGGEIVLELKEKVTQHIHQALAEAARSEENTKGGGRLTTPAVRGISSQCFREVKHLDKGRLFDLCEGLLELRNWPERAIAFDWAFRFRKRFEESDFATFERWLSWYVDGWGSCDDFCTHAFGSLILQYPALIPDVMEWTESDNRWFRRAAPVVMLYSIRRGEHVDAAFQIADRLLLDEDDMAQKGYGWLLKEIGKRVDPMRVFEYVMAHKAVMPRTALRYAIEKLDPELRKEAMER
jgi:3-methyladenine DNA glycosylase AlkD